MQVRIIYVVEYLVEGVQVLQVLEDDNTFDSI